MPVAYLLVGAACTNFEREPDWFRHGAGEPGAWEATGQLDAMEAAAIWGVGDCVSYAIDFDNAGEHRHFTFTLTTEKLPPPKTGGHHMPNPVHGGIVTTTARAGFQWGPIVLLAYTGRATVRAELRGEDGTLCHGVFEQEAIDNMWQEDVRHACLCSVHEVFKALLRLDGMLTRLQEVIRPPSLLAIARHLGSIAVSLDWPHGPVEATEQETLIGRLPCCWVPFAIDACGEPALDGRVQFTWKRSPLLPSAGVLQIEAWRPDDPTRRVTARLVGARRGTPADAPDPDELLLGLRTGMSVAEVCRVKGGTVKRTVPGRLADGRRVELVEFDVRRAWLFGIADSSGLLFACAGDRPAQYWLKHRGFVADVAEVAPVSESGR